jgi:hypothetical protein
MAIIISEGKKQFNWLPFLIVGVLLIFTIVGIYMLFFASAPLIEYIAPSSQKTISDISAIKSDQFVSDINSTQKELQNKIKQIAPTAVGTPSANEGRNNPFLSF